MGLICCFTCKWEKFIDGRSMTLPNQRLEFEQTKKLHKCEDKYGRYFEPDLVFFVSHPKRSKAPAYGFTNTYHAYCGNCLDDTYRLTYNEIRYWFFYTHYGKKAVKKSCIPSDLHVRYIEDYVSLKEQQLEKEAAALAEYMEEQGISKEDLSQETRVEEGNEDVAAWIRLEPGRNNALEVSVADDILDGRCAFCDFSFTIDKDIKKKVFAGYDELYEAKWRLKTQDEIRNEYLHKRFTELFRHFKECHYYETMNDNNDTTRISSHKKLPKVLTVTYGILQQLVLYENALKMEYSLRTSTKKQKTNWKAEHNNKNILVRYREFSDKRASVVRNLYKEYLLPTKLISELLLSFEKTIREKGFKGMLVNEDVPKWLIDVTQTVYINNR